MKLNLGSGSHPLDGFENLDRPAWRWEDGLPYLSGTVDAITVSHSLMYAKAELWTFVFSEMARVLRPCGVLRITEDATTDPLSERYGGFPGAVSLTSPAKVVAAMTGRFSGIVQLAPDETMWEDRSLIQRWHGEPPKVFHIEGRK